MPKVLLVRKVGLVSQMPLVAMASMVLKVPVVLKFKVLTITNPIMIAAIISRTMIMTLIM